MLSLLIHAAARTGRLTCPCVHTTALRRSQFVRFFHNKEVFEFMHTAVDNTPRNANASPWLWPVGNDTDEEQRELRKFYAMYDNFDIVLDHGSWTQRYTTPRAV